MGHVVEEFLIHTGQHYDWSMSGAFFDEGVLRQPDISLGIGSGSHGEQTGRMLEALEKIFLGTRFNAVLVYGDTNTTLAAALAAAKLQIPLIHVEAGLRCFNRSVPEEINRVVADHLAHLLCCPSHQAAQQLGKEGIQHGVHVTGDVMLDSLLDAWPDALSSAASSPWDAEQRAVLTLHRPQNVDFAEMLRLRLEQVGHLQLPVIWPTHPRSVRRLAEFRIALPANIQLVEPQPFREMLRLVATSRMVITDSGGLQKESYWLRRPCFTLRPETEWPETVAVGWNTLIGFGPDDLRAAALNWAAPPHDPGLYGDGHASEHVIRAILDELGNEA